MGSNCLVLAMTAAFLVCQPGAHAQTGAGVVASRNVEELGATFDRHILTEHLGQFWGQVLVARRGEVIFAKGYGVTDGSLRPVDDRTIMDVGSIAKQFTAAAVLRLEMEGKLSTDDPVSKHFPDAGGAADRVTLYQLLTHTSGLSDRTGAIQALTFPDRDKAVELAMGSPLGHAPGEAFEYCNGGYVVLGAVVEKASGRPFEEYVRGSLFVPAGMRSTGFLDGANLDLSNAGARVVEREGRKARRLGILQDGWGWGFKGCGGVLTNVHDLLAWDRALRGDLVLDAVARAKLYNADKGGYALGWFVERTPEGKRVHHSGGTRGFRAEFSRDLEEDVVVAVITNERNDPVGLAKKLRALLAGRTGTPPTTINLSGLEASSSGLAEIKGDAAVLVAKDGAGVKLRVMRGDASGEAIVESVVERETAAMLAHELPIAVKWGEKSRKRAVAKGIDLVVATSPYSKNAGGLYEVPGEAGWMPYPSYRSSEGEDPRPTLVLVDEDAGFWPVILKMDPDSALDLAARIEAALK